MTELIHQAVTLLKAGELVAIPTETVYGLAGDASNIQSIEKIFALKGRPKSHPLIIHLASLEAMPAFATTIPTDAWKLAERFWPGPLTLLLPKQPQVPLLVTAGQNSVALRIPNHPLTLNLLQAFNGGLVAPSANRFMGVSPTTAEHVAVEFKSELGKELSLILDGGPCQLGIESTIVSFLNKDPVILRQGMILASQLSETLGREVRISNPDSEKIAVPGACQKHYSPRTALYLIEASDFESKLNYFLDQQQRIGVLSFRKKPDDFQTAQGIWIHLQNNPQSVAKHLYAWLRDLDHAAALKAIVVEKPEVSEDWGAIIDRLQRASH